MTDSTISGNAIVIERTFEAPASTIWKMWTEPEHFKNWYGPNGFSVPVAELDVRVGGRRLVCMQMERPDGNVMTMWTVGEHTEVSHNERLAYTESMSDENGNVISPADMGMPGYPASTLVTIELEDVGGSTKMTMTHAGLPADSPGASGWNQAFDKLASYVQA